MHFIYQNTYFHPALAETIAVSRMHALGFVGNYRISYYRNCYLRETFLINTPVTSMILTSDNFE